MILLAKLIILTVMIASALKVVMSEGMLLEKLGAYFKRKQDKGYRWVDLFYCEWCCVTLQSITAHAFAFGLGILPLSWNWQLLIRWPLVVFGASFISGNLWNVYLTINKIKERNEQEAIYFEILNHDNINGDTSGNM